MQEYDELTGCIIDEKSADDSTIEENTTAQDNDSETPKKEDLKESFQTIEDKNPINRKLILIISLSIIAIVIIYTFLIPILAKGPSSKQYNSKNASDIDVPNFANYYTPENQENETTTDDSYLPSKKPVNTYSSPIKAESKKQNFQVQTSTSLSEIDRAALDSEYKDCKMAKLYSTDTTTNVSPLDNILSSPTAFDTQGSSYVQDRLNSYAGIPGGQENTYSSQNNQSNKQDFYTSDSTIGGNGNYLNSFTLWKGTIIPAILITSINTDIPGMVKAQVTENIYDSKTGKTLLIPQGSFLIAEYSSSISYNQNRIQIAWNTLTRPDGYQINLGNMPATDSKGMSGVKGTCSNHFFEYVKAMGIITFFTAINGEFNNSINSTDNQSVQNLLAANQNTTTELGAKLIDKALDIQPTLKKMNGKSIKIFTNKNIFLPPLESHKVTKKYTND